MNRQVKTTPRKRPRQDRAKATVDTILAASARVLVKRGFDGFTTNEVASAAGVSIGSLYQYYPNKEALVAALLEQHVEEMSAMLMGELARVSLLPMAQAVRVVIEMTIRAHAVEPELHRVLTEQVPRVGRLARIREETAAVSTMLASIFREDDVAAPAIANPMPDPTDHALPGLDAAHTRILLALAEQPIEGDAFEALCREQRLLPEGAIETINDWAFDTFDDPVIENDDLVCIQPHLIASIRTMATA